MGGGGGANPPITGVTSGKARTGMFAPRSICRRRG
jgi:hypothetical protein